MATAQQRVVGLGFLGGVITLSGRRSNAMGAWGVRFLRGLTMGVAQMSSLQQPMVGLASWGVITSNIAVPNADGRLEYSSAGLTTPCGTNGRPPPTTVSGGLLGGVITTDPVVAQNADGRLEAFAGTDNAVWHKWQTAPNNGGRLGFLGVSSPATLPWHETRIAVWRYSSAGRTTRCGIAGKLPNNGWVRFCAQLGFDIAYRNRLSAHSQCVLVQVKQTRSSQIET
jgi:hypothetical protein